MQHTQKISLRWLIGLLSSLIGLLMILMVPTSAHATAGTVWTSRTSLADNNWRTVTYGNSLFVVVANTGLGNRVMTSPDGVIWTSRTSAVDNDWVGQAIVIGISNINNSTDLYPHPLRDRDCKIILRF